MDFVLDVYDDGKYKLILSEDFGTIKCLRYGREWRDLTGDNLVLGLIYKIQELEENNYNLKVEIENLMRKAN